MSHPILPLVGVCVCVGGAVKHIVLYFMLYFHCLDGCVCRFIIAMLELYVHSYFYLLCNIFKLEMQGCIGQ